MDAALRLSPVRDESDLIVGVSETTRDVSAEMQTRVALEANERRYRARYEQANVPQAFADLQGCIVNANDAMCRLLGRERAQLQGIPVGSLRHSTDTAAADKRLAAVLDGTAGDRLLGASACALGRQSFAGRRSCGAGTRCRRSP